MSPENNLLVLALDSIRLDGGTQIRVGISQTVVDEYAEILAQEQHLPPLCVFQDESDYRLADGFHRWRALKKNGRTEALCHGYRGSRRDAVLAAVRANHHHGLRRSNEDKRRAVETLLADKEWAANADRWIAEMCGVSHTLVANVRSQLATVASCQKGGDEARVGQDGLKRRLPMLNRERPAQLTDGAPSAIDAALQAALAFDVCLTRMNDLIRAGEKLVRGPGGGYLQRRWADYTGHLQSAAALLKEVKPRVRCLSCGGGGCTACLMLGYVCGAPESA
ncbi:MAG TPA: ParB N-terminal domain-containing protein [Pirellulales bacterium]|nr:ParB N-terminal domain-containing protein [Pirellulales bacterium]